MRSAFFNQTWLDFTGRTLEEEWGVGWAEGIHFEDFQRCIDTYMAAFAERRTFEMEYRLRRADGQYRWVLDRGTPRWERDGRFAGYIGSCADITDRKDLELDLMRAVTMRDEFLSIASHELRTPLTALRLQIDRVARAIDRGAIDRVAPELSRERPPRRERELAARRAQVARLHEPRRAAARHLALRRGTASRLDHEELDLVALVGEVVEAMREPAQIAGSELRFTAPASLRGSWDRLRIEQLVTNLLGNAAKFGAKRPIDITLDAVASSDLTLDAVASSDDYSSTSSRPRAPRASRSSITASAVDPQYQRRIFGRFERAVSTARRFGRLGLRL